MARGSQRTAGAALPPMNIPAAVRHASEWAGIPTHARVLHAMAHASGLAVTHTADPAFAYLSRQHLQGRAGFLWIGTGDAFKGCGIFKASTNWAFMEWGSTETGEGLRVDLLRPDAAKDVVVAFHERYAPIGSRSFARFAAMAAADGDYQAFRGAVLQPVEVSVAKGEVWEEWRGPVQITLTAQVVKWFQRRALFGPITRAAKKADGAVGMSEETARLMRNELLLNHPDLEFYESANDHRRHLFALLRSIDRALAAYKGRQHG